MKIPVFRSPLAKYMIHFVNLKRLQQFKYNDQASKLIYFDRFLIQQKFNRSQLNQPIINQYITTLHPLHVNTRYHYLTVVRQFSLYLHQIIPKSYVLDKIPVRRIAYRRPYIFNKKEINALLHAAKSLAPADSIRSHTLHMLLGLLAITGMRISEALGLIIADLHKDNHLLYIRKSKFSKNRWIPLTDSSADMLQNYLLIRRRHYPISGDNTPLFMNSRGNPMTRRSVHKTFADLIKQCFIGGKHLKSPPRIHDLRHSFAVQRLVQWYHEGKDVNAQLPALATYLGHVNIGSTQIYLRMTPELAELANQRFNSNFQMNILKKGSTK